MTWKHGLFVYLGLLLCAQARLGENEQQLTARFGEPGGRSKHVVITQGKIIPMGPVLYFRQGDWSISCDLVDGVCMRIGYSKPGDWSEDQIALVLNSNRQGAKWDDNSKPMIAKLRRDWRRSDGSTAVWQKGIGMTLVWDAYNKAKAKVEEQARVEAMKKPKI